MYGMVWWAVYEMWSGGMVQSQGLSDQSFIIDRGVRQNIWQVYLQYLVD